MRLLLALPLVVAVSMAGSATLISLIPDNLQQSATTWWGLVLRVALLSLSGLPVVAYTFAFILALVRRRWKKIGVLVAGAVVPAVMILTLSLWAVSNAKPAIEHYNWSGWHQALIWGAYVAGVLMLAARACGPLAGSCCRCLACAAVDDLSSHEDDGPSSGCPF